MLQYEFERVNCDAPSNYSLFSGIVPETAEHRVCILRRAEEGWRYVGFVPVGQRASGYLTEIDLIFEKETE